jgi:hypothetical protein
MSLVEPAQVNNDNAPMAATVAGMHINIGECSDNQTAVPYLKIAGTASSMGPRTTAPLRGTTSFPAMWSNRTSGASAPYRQPADTYIATSEARVSVHDSLGFVRFYTYTSLISVFTTDVSFNQDADTHLSFENEEIADESPFLPGGILSLWKTTYHNPDVSYDSAPQ